MNQQTNSPGQRREVMYNDLVQFIQTGNKEVQSRLLTYSWEQFFLLLKEKEVPQPIKQASCAALKSLVYQKKFVKAPLEMLKEFVSFYLEPHAEKLTKVQETSEIVIQQIISMYLNKPQKEDLIEELAGSFGADTITTERKIKIVSIIIETTDPETINNQVLIGEITLYLKDLLASSTDPELKNRILYQLFKLIDKLFNIIDEIEQDQNIPESCLRTSQDGRRILESIIVEASEGKQIITQSQSLNRVKVLVLEVYSRTWAYYLEQNMFDLFLSSLLLTPVPLHDQQSEIMEHVLNLLDRSLCHQPYLEQVYPLNQQIVVNLLRLLAQVSEAELASRDPEYFVEVLTEYCKGQNKEMLMMRIGGLIANLCMNVDGCLSFLGSMCIIVFKSVDSSLTQNQEEKSFIMSMNQVWDVSFQEKLSVSLMVLAALSDQTEKRKDLQKPIYNHLYNMNKIFTLGKVNLPPHIICKFMNLYAFYGYCGCLDVFLPYKSVLPLYQCQLEACYQTFDYYHRRKGKEFEQYILSLGKAIILSNKLTLLLEKTITAGEKILQIMQIPILQQLVVWLQEAYENNPPEGMKINKFSNLIVVLLNKFIIHKEEDEQPVVYSYLVPLYKSLITRSHEFEQTIIEIALGHLKLFPSLKNKEQRVGMFLEICSVVVQRNKFILNSCLDIYIHLVNGLNEDKVKNLMKDVIGIIDKQERNEDLWECLFLVEVCLVQLAKLNSALPDTNFPTFLGQILPKASSKVLYIKILEVFLAFFLVNPNFDPNLAESMRKLILPEEVPPYENKAYLMYLIGFLRVPHHPLEYTRYLLQLICTATKREKKIKSEIKNYENSIYSFDENLDQVATTSLMKSQTIIHPLCEPSVDYYQFFKQVWDGYPFKQDLKAILPEEELKNVRDLWNKQMVRNLPRKVVKIKQLKVSL